MGLEKSRRISWAMKAPRWEEDLVGRETLKEGQPGAWPGGGGFPGASWEDFKQSGTSLGFWHQVSQMEGEEPGMEGKSLCGLKGVMVWGQGLA